MKKILFFLKVPPPFTGATYINSLVNNSRLLNNTFLISKINVSYKSSIESRRVFSISKFFKIISYHFLLLKGLIWFKPHIIYFQISPLGWAFLRDCTYIFLIKIFRKKLVLHLHGKGIAKSTSKSLLLSWLYKFVFNGSELICLSESLTYDIKQVYQKKLYIVPNAIAQFENINIKKRKGNRLRVLFLSNILKSKGFLDFLDSIEIFQKNNCDEIEAIIIGTAIDFSKDQINYEISKRNLNDVVNYKGPLYGKEKQNALSIADVLVFPTLNDVWGLVILEAMQIGIPVIATREGAIPEIIEDGVTGFIVSKHSPDQIAEKLNFFVNNPDYIQKMGNAGKKRYLEKYTLDIFETNMKNVFEDVLNKCNVQR